MKKVHACTVASIMLRNELIAPHDMNWFRVERSLRLEKVSVLNDF